MREDGNRDRRRAEAGGAEYRVPDEDHERREDQCLRRNAVGSFRSHHFPSSRPATTRKPAIVGTVDFAPHRSAAVRDFIPRVPVLIIGGPWILTLSTVRKPGPKAHSALCDRDRRQLCVVLQVAPRGAGRVGRPSPRPRRCPRFWRSCPWTAWWSSLAAMSGPSRWPRSIRQSPRGSRRVSRPRRASTLSSTRGASRDSWTSSTCRTLARCCSRTRATGLISAPMLL